ncbi:MAG: type II secretion system protein [Verrucomicrobia bacterium]|nr:type II secretion system protein [Verrucomicrobiota bacterium]
MRSRSPSSSYPPAPPRSVAAFTLLELLVVMSIIGILAGMVVGLAPVASTKMKEARVRTELQQLVTLIESYKSRFGVYPPDGVRRVLVEGQGFQTLSNPALSPLFYELSGVYLTNAASVDGYFIPRADADDGDGIRSVELQTWFGREGILNAKPYELRNRLFVTDFKEGQYAEVFRNRSDAGYADIEVLAVGFSSDASGKRINGLAWPNNRTDHPVPSNKGLNPWRYVSTNPTNNPGGFDLWAEIPVGRDRVKIIGNWKESN